VSSPEVLPHSMPDLRAQWISDFRIRARYAM
jgi:hypothetical protein